MTGTGEEGRPQQVGSVGRKSGERLTSGAGRPGREEARRSVWRSRETVALLERASGLMSEDEPMQPAANLLHTALCEAEVRLGVLEDWYSRTYGSLL